MPIANETAVGHAPRQIAAVSRSRATASANVSSAAPRTPPTAAAANRAPSSRTRCNRNAPPAYQRSSSAVATAAATVATARPTAISARASCRAATRPTASAAAATGAGHRRGASRRSAPSRTPAAGDAAPSSRPPGCSHHVHSAATTQSDADQHGRCARPHAVTERRRGGRRSAGVGNDVGQRVLRARRRLDRDATNREPSENRGRTGERARGQDGPVRHRGRGGGPPPTVPGRGGYLAPISVTTDRRPSASSVIGRS